MRKRFLELLGRRSIGQILTVGVTTVMAMTIALITLLDVLRQRALFLRFGFDALPVEAEIRQTVYQHVWQGLLAVTVGTFLVVGLTRRLTRPIRQLARLSHKISEGKLEQDVDIRSYGEVNELTAAFELMMKRLRASRDQEELYHRRLQERVEERTRELRAANETLQESQRTLSVLLGHLPGMAYRCRNDESWSMEFVSDGCFDLTGYRAEDLIERRETSYVQLIHAEDRDFLRESVQSALEKGKPFQVGYGLTTAAGEERRVWHQGRGIVSPEGEVLALEGFIADVTEQHRLEARVRHQDKMAAVGLLAAGVAHEVGNPLSSISAVTQNLMRKAGDPYVAEKLDLVAHNVERISTILHQMGEFARPPRQKWSRCSINGLLRNSVDMLRYDQRARQVRIVLDLTKSLPPIYAMADQLTQVFFNLALNALDALTSVSDLRPRRLYVSSGSIRSPRGPVLEIAFEDNGPGIPAAALPRIFEPFFTTKPPGKDSGMGLGLALSYRIVEEHGGLIRAEDSRPGEGARFVVELPVRDRQPEEAL